MIVENVRILSAVLVGNGISFRYGTRCSYNIVIQDGYI